MKLPFQTPTEIAQQVCRRLKQERLLHEWTQADLASRAGVGVTTISNLEAGHNISFATLVRVAMVLGRGEEIADLFQPQVNSLGDMQKLEHAKSRQRIREKKHD